MTDVAATVPFPTALVGGSSTPYVGRARLLDDLAARWRRAAAGNPSAVLLAGEPGVGKTRTAAELARRAHDEGALVLYGGCDEGLGAPYQPFVEALRWYTSGDGESIGPLGRLPGELTRLFRDLGKRVDSLPAPVPSDPSAEEYRLFEAVTSWLVEAARHTGLVLVLDDVHWATKPTLLLILHVVRAVSHEDARLLIIVNYRDTEIDRTHPLSRVLGDLRQLPAVERAPVDNLTELEVVALIEANAGHAMGAAGVALGAAVFAETEGNPFFVAEVLRHLVETGAIDETGDRWTADAATFAIPEGVREVVGRRLSRLSVTANEVLTVAAVQGRDVDIDVLDAVTDASEEDVLDALDEATAARLLEEVSVGHYRFAHALVRATLYEELLATRRRLLHRRIAAALEKLRPGDVVALAYHYAVGGTEGGEPDRALRYGLAAAEQSLAARAFADAEDRFRQVLELADDDTIAGVIALCGLGECQRDQGNPEFRATLLDASRRALALSDTPVLVRAVLANSRGMASFVGELDGERIALIEATLDAIGPEPSADRARLLAQLSAEVTYGADNARRIALSDEAEAMARRLGDDAVLAWVLARTGYSAILPSRAAQLIERGKEGTRLADGTGDPSLRVFARIFQAGALLFAGRIHEAFAVSDDAVALAEAECPPTTRWLAHLNAMPASFARRGARATAQHNDACLAMGQDAGEADALQWWGAAASSAFWLTGEGGDVADVAGIFAAQYPLFRVWVTGYAWMLCEGDRHDEARAVVDAHDLRFNALEDENLPLTATQQLASLAWELDDAEMARTLIPVLEKYVGCWAHYFLAPVGPISWALGATLSVVGDYDRALPLLDDALAALLDAGYRDHAVHCRIHTARILLRRNAPGDRARVEALLADARAHAETMPAPRLVERIDLLLDHS